MNTIIKYWEAEHVRRMTEAEKKLAMITPHFSVWEVECKCGCGFARIKPRLGIALEQLRELVGKPVLTRWGHQGRGGSVCRCPTHNRNIGGSENSQHMQGKAADIRVPGYTPEQLAIVMEHVGAFENGGIGVYPWGVHGDVRFGKKRW